MDYKKSGVNVEKANMLTEIIRSTVANDNIGMFAGIYDHPLIPEYSLVGCTDGVGTKVIPLLENNLIDNIAIDLLAMNLNDLICVGASPMFFLDYFATHTLDVELTARFIKSLKQVLSEYNCTLLGGETAELKDLITEGHFDVGGFLVGIVKKDKILRKTNVSEGDTVIGLRSSGPHSNGYTLIRKLYESGLISKEELLETLVPTHIYAKEILELCDKQLLKVCAHITGGGIVENLERVLPEGLSAQLIKKNIPVSPVFDKLSSVVGEKEAYKAFNMGVGMCLVVSPDKADEVMKICNRFEPFIFGEIKRITDDEKDHRVWLG